ncbi:MAG: patatin-like phospholipase family protein [Pseudonocardiaceae bacterium]
MTVAFVLQGGGGLAATQVGQLRALREFGITPDLMVGTSSGALNAVAFAQDPTDVGLERLERLWTGLRRGDVFPLDALGVLGGLVDVVTGLIGWRDGLVSPTRLRALIERNLMVSRLEDTAIPVHVVATDMGSGQPIVLSAGPALDALLASTALPGVFPPVVIEGRPLVDGGVAADTPIRQAEDLGATVTYVLPTVSSAPPWQLPRGAVPVLLRAISQVLGHASATDLSAARNEVHVLPAPSRIPSSPFDFRSAAELIAAGYDEAKAALDHRTAA